ncbi:uncharacterized protein HKW66_Vig0145870 [Vigna angularis]|uniref:Uncharacterized protein n=1 Tax=Phaseolus angularis TaxID=3914 RepID=A0A8T0KBG3_PHAAN|nr:uncharacterized protein HKW66_Vig0145870 [Vigna angularis]
MVVKVVDSPPLEPLPRLLIVDEERGIEISEGKDVGVDDTVEELRGIVMPSRDEADNHHAIEGAWERRLRRRRRRRRMIGDRQRGRRRRANEDSNGNEGATEFLEELAAVAAGGGGDDEGGQVGLRIQRKVGKMGIGKTRDNWIAAKEGPCAPVHDAFASPLSSFTMEI